MFKEIISSSGTTGIIPGGILDGIIDKFSERILEGIPDKIADEILGGLPEEIFERLLL